MNIEPPFLLFLGDARDALAAKTAQGIAYWRPDWCLGQLRLDDCHADLGVEDITVAAAAARGARTLIVGVANRGGVLSGAWLEVLTSALAHGMDVASGLHNRLADVPALAAAAAAHGRALHDVRHTSQHFPLGNGAARTGKRLLTTGTDVSIGKMYTSLALEREMHKRGMKADFRATGQTGIFIAGSGVAIDAIVSDFISGAVEWLTPANDADHWDLIEGQGSIVHPSYAGVTLGLIHGAAPHALVHCHDPTRKHVRGLPDYPLVGLEEVMEACLWAAKRTNPAARYVGISVNTAALSEAEASRTMRELEDAQALPVVDPLRDGVGRIVDQL